MLLNLLKSSFQIEPYDAQASALFARLWRQKKEEGVVESAQRELQATRQELKADCMIVATALAKNAEVIYSHDDKLKKFAGTSIEVKELPILQYQSPIDFEFVQ